MLKGLDRYITGNYGEDQFRILGYPFCDFMNKNGEDCNLPCAEPDCRCKSTCDEKCPHYSPYQLTVEDKKNEEAEKIYEEAAYKEWLEGQKQEGR